MILYSIRAVGAILPITGFCLWVPLESADFKELHLRPLSAPALSFWMSLDVRMLLSRPQQLYYFLLLVSEPAVGDFIVTTGGNPYPNYTDVILSFCFQGWSGYAISQSDCDRIVCQYRLCTHIILGASAILYPCLLLIRFTHKVEDLLSPALLQRLLLTTSLFAMLHSRMDKGFWLS